MHTAFQTYRLNDVGAAKATKVAEAFDRFLTYLDKEFLTSPGEAKLSRERSIVITKLEEASFYTKKCLSSQPENQTT